MNEKEKSKIAIALKYDQENGDAPKVIAKGTGEIAKNIIKKGEEAGVTSLENKSLAQELFQLEVNQEIPEDLYTAVAEILTYVYKLDNEKR